MSTPAAASAAPAADAASKPQPSTEARPGKEGLADVSREVTSEVTADGMRIESNWCVNSRQQQAETNAAAEQRRGLRGGVRCRPVWTVAAAALPFDWHSVHATLSQSTRLTGVFSRVCVRVRVCCACWCVCV